MAATAPRPTTVAAASLPQRVPVAAGAPPAATVRRPLGLFRAGVIVVLAGAAWWATGHVHQGHRAAAAAGSVLARPILEPACGPWHHMAQESAPSREEVSAQASAARAPFEQARQVDPNAGLDDAVTAVQFLDSLQEPGQSGASDAEVSRAVSVVDAACRPYR